MPEKFNPFDPLGLFQERDGTQGRRTLSPPPDPLGLFKRTNPGNPSPPDPLGILTPGIPDPMRRRGVTIGNPIPIEWADQVVPIKTQVREQLIGRGYRPQQVDLALHWAEEWLIGMARRLAPGNPDLQKTVVVSGYADIGSRAERWLTGMEAVFAPAGAVR